MMAVVTFFNRWLRVKLRLDAKDWPETHDNDPEPYTDEEAAKLETASAGEINLLIRTFRHTGFPNDQGRVDGHLLRKIKDEVRDCVQGIKLHRWRDLYITNKLRDQIDIVTAATWAGHDDINVTRSYAALGWISQSKAARDSANREDTRYRKTGTQGD